MVKSCAISIVACVYAIAWGSPCPASAADVSAECVLRSLATLPAQQHVSMISLTAGQTLIASDRVLDVLSATGERRPFELTMGQLADALGVPASVPTILAVAALSPDDLILYTTGSSGNRSASAVWAYHRSTKHLSLVADATALGHESGMGSAVDLADAQIAVAGDDVWLLLRNVDDAVFFRLDRRQLADTSTARLARPFKALTTPESTPFSVRPDDRVFGQADGSFELLRTSTGESWQISSTGQTQFNDESTAHPPTPLPPLSLPRERFNGRSLTVRFFPEPIATTPLGPSSPDATDTNGPRYPLITVTEIAKETAVSREGRPTEIARDAIHGRAAFPIHALRFTAWCVDAASGDVIAYDAMSGEVMRLRLKE